MDTRASTNPFPGLRPFMPEEADLFFGRDKQSDELVRRLASRRFLAVVGTSGSGKSSLVRAGLLPSLEGGFMAEAGAHWRIAILRPQDDPIGFLARTIVATGALAHLDLAQSAAEGVVETTLRRSGLGLVEAARVARLEPHENLLIVVDQFEELFRFADLARQRGAGDEAPAFVKLLLEAARQSEVPVYVVITMRSDFLGDCARFRDLPEAISDCQYLIPRLTRDELQAVITGPIGVRGGRIAPSLVQRLLNDIGDDMDQLPVLQHALMRAWDHWERSDPTGRPIELSDLEAIGGMAEALSRHADEAFGSLASERDREIAERLFKCLTERGPDNREIRRPTQLSRITAIANADPAEIIRVIDVFRAPGRSFLMPPHGITLAGDSVIDISHESLIRQWARLRTWVEEEAESRATYLRLLEAARLHRAGKAGLWGEPDLTYARQWQVRDAPNATWAERYGFGFDEASAFLRDSEAGHTAELEQEHERAEAERIAKERELEQAKALAEAHRQRADEQVRTERERAVRRRAVFSAITALVALAAASWWIFDRTMRERRDAEANELVAEAHSNLSKYEACRVRQRKTDCDSKALLENARAKALEAVTQSPTERAKMALNYAIGAKLGADVAKPGWEKPLAWRPLGPKVGPCDGEPGQGGALCFVGSAGQLVNLAGLPESSGQDLRFGTDPNEEWVAAAWPKSGGTGTPPNGTVQLAVFHLGQGNKAEPVGEIRNTKCVGKVAGVRVSSNGSAVTIDCEPSSEDAPTWDLITLSDEAEKELAMSPEERDSIDAIYFASPDEKGVAKGFAKLKDGGVLEITNEPGRDPDILQTDILRVMGRPDHIAFQPERGFAALGKFGVPIVVVHEKTGKGPGASNEGRETIFTVPFGLGTPTEVNFSPKATCVEVRTTWDGKQAFHYHVVLDPEVLKDVAKGMADSPPRYDAHKLCGFPGK